jgi:hypothetical protein
MLAKTKALGPVTASSLPCRGLAPGFEAGVAAQKRQHGRGGNQTYRQKLYFRAAGTPGTASRWSR